MIGLTMIDLTTIALTLKWPSANMPSSGAWIPEVLIPEGLDWLAALDWLSALDWSDLDGLDGFGVLDAAGTVLLLIAIAGILFAGAVVGVGVITLGCWCVTGIGCRLRQRRAGPADPLFVLTGRPGCGVASSSCLPATLPPGGPEPARVWRKPGAPDCAGGGGASSRPTAARDFLICRSRHPERWAGLAVPAAPLSRGENGTGTSRQPDVTAGRDPHLSRPPRRPL